MEPSFLPSEQVVAVPREKWRKGKVEAIVDEVGHWREALVDKPVDRVDRVEGHIANPVDSVHGDVSNVTHGVHGNVAHTMGRVHGHVPSVVQSVHHLVLHHLDCVEGHVRKVVDHVGHHAHDVVVGVVGRLGGAEPGELLGAGGPTGAVRAGGARAVDLPPQDVPRLPVVTDVQADIELAGPETTSGSGSIKDYF